MDDRPICFFDSGIGGSTILKEVIKKLPNEDYIYYADSKNNPYGNKTKKELFDIVCCAVDNLIKYNPKLIVCACNTATEVVLNDIRKKYKDMMNNYIIIWRKQKWKILKNYYQQVQLYV